ERVGHLRHHAKPAREVECLPPAMEARAVDLLHDEVVQPVGLAEVVDPDDVLVDEPREDLGLEPESAAERLAAPVLQDVDHHRQPARALRSYRTLIATGRPRTRSVAR